MVRHKVTISTISVVADPPTGGQENEKEGSEDDDDDEEEEEEEEETDEESEEEGDDDEMEHSGTESDKAVSTQPDIIATAAAVTGEPGISSSPPPAAVSEDHVITEDTPTDAVDTPSVATNEPKEPSKFLPITMCIYSDPLLE